MKDVLGKMLMANIEPEWSKCSFGMEPIKFCGHIVDSNGTRVDPVKARAINNMPFPKSYDELNTFIGMCEWHRNWVKDFATIIQPLQSLKNSRKFKICFQWNEKCSKSFNKLKDAILNSGCNHMTGPGTYHLHVQDIIYIESLEE